MSVRSSVPSCVDPLWRICLGRGDDAETDKEEQADGNERNRVRSSFQSLPFWMGIAVTPS